MTLQDFFRDNPKAALAFSGGADSAYLLYAALENGAETGAYYVKSPFQPRFELEDARALDSVMEKDVVTNFHVAQILTLRHELLETLSGH